MLVIRCEARYYMYLFTKRISDVVGALAGLLMLSPVLILVAVRIRMTMGSPIFFRQERPGKDGKPFMMLKLRTMTNERGEDGELLPDGERLTRPGKFLRKTSLDEFPEFINVLKGDMSLVGPRPLLIRYLDRYTPEQSRRHEVRPGVTGWAQINGRNTLSWDKKLELDVLYIDTKTVYLDIKILLLTIWKVFRRDGISADEHATMPEFMSKSEK